MLTRVSAEHEPFEFAPTATPICEVDAGAIVSFETGVAVLRQLAAGAALDSVDLERDWRPLSRRARS